MAWLRDSCTPFIVCNLDKSVEHGVVPGGVHNRIGVIIPRSSLLTDVAVDAFAGNVDVSHRRFA
ncbi:hypothetical protein GNP10_14605 [Escherichia coli]|nr:hypothetical protein [Escherichia coli]